MGRDGDGGVSRKDAEARNDAKSRPASAVGESSSLTERCTRVLRTILRSRETLINRMFRFKGAEYVTLVLLAGGAFAATYVATRAARQETDRAEPAASGGRPARGQAGGRDGPARRADEGARRGARGDGLDARRASS